MGHVWRWVGLPLLSKHKASPSSLSPVHVYEKKDGWLSPALLCSVEMASQCEWDKGTRFTALKSEELWILWLEQAAELASAPDPSQCPSSPWSLLCVLTVLHPSCILQSLGSFKITPTLCHALIFLIELIRGKPWHQCDFIIRLPEIWFTQSKENLFFFVYVPWALAYI